MPRPQPIIIPGPYSMGGTRKSKESYVDLGSIIKLYDALVGAPRREAANVEAVKALGPLFKEFSPGPAPQQKAISTATDEETTGPSGPLPPAYAVNMGGGIPPAAPAVDINTLAKSGFGRDIVKGLMGDKFGAAQKNLNFDTFTDEEGIDWRIGYDPLTGAEVTRTKQGKGREQVRDAYKEDAILTRIVNSFNADPNVRKAEQMDAFSNLVTDIAASDNPIGHASLDTLMARASSEVGMLSEADKKPFGGSRALNQKIKQSFSELYSGKKTPENLAFISQLAETFKEAGKNKKISLARERANQYAQANKGMGWTPKEIFKTLSPFGEYEEKKAGPEKPAAGGVDLNQFWRK